MLVTEEAGPRCWAYSESGSICGKLVIIVDPNRGCTVCADHVDPILEGRRSGLEREE